MQVEDARGCPLTVSLRESGEATDRFRDTLLSMGPGLEDVLPAAERDPDCAMLQVQATLVRLLGISRASQREAAAPLARARETAREPRERAWLTVVSRWSEGNLEATLDACEAVTREWPRDLAALKIAEFLHYLCGQLWTAPRLRAHVERLAEANADCPHFLAMRAFAAELCGDLEAAERLSARAIEQEFKTPWAHHALAHLHARRAEPGRGAERLEAARAGWENAGAGTRSHNAWHLALLKLECLDPESALALHASSVFDRDRENFNIQLDAISLLWRIELAGFEVGDAWSGVLEEVLFHAGDFPVPYAAAHHAFLFGRTGAAAALEATLQEAERQAREAFPLRRDVWTRGGLAMVQGCAAAGRGDAATAVAKFGPQISRVGAGGGSDAQVDLFHQAHFAALRDAGRGGDARGWLVQRCEGREPTPLEQRWRQSVR